MSPIIELVDHPKFPQIECTGTRNTVSTYAVYCEESTATHPRFFLPYYLVIPKVVATSLAHAAARMTKAKFVLQTMMLRNLALKACFFPGKKSKKHGRCEVFSYHSYTNPMG